MEITSRVYKPRDPGTTALYEVVRDNPEGRACGEARRRASGGAEGDGASPREVEQTLAVDSYRVFHCLTHWVEGGALRPRPLAA